MVMQRWRSGKGLIPWRPFRELENIEQHFEDVFDRSWLPAVWRRIPSLEMGWAPAVEVFEKEGKFVVKAELPGIKEEDMDISVVDNTLTIKGEKKTESEVKEEDYYCCECSYGSFSRSIALPSNVDAKKIAASYEDGVLGISLPKASEVKPKKISISAKKKEKASR
ncbi:MAG: molecular chaperone Hsp20 [Dehalococcoidales bacterium]|jgi:HSP20 family protein|nr:molecular chaperone Hsp20 [Dehalococcoidales bacterium]MDP6448883.1 Hsp20/alpha crystallin family protein [Dehalococcoidales bacterium]MDP6824650.1 Hsp20/alpha crystallin family protein [Dehalococcoidales bacterium]